MDICEIMVEKDFYKLGNDDISGLIKALNLGLNKENETKSYLYEKRREIFKASELAQQIILNKVFAGRTSIKWYKLINMTDEIKSEIISKINKLDYFDNNITSKMKLDNLEGPSCYTCINQMEGVYIFRFIVPDREKTEFDGINLTRKRNNKNIIVVLNLNCNLIEVRSDCRTANKIIEKLRLDLVLTNVIDYNFTLSIEELKDKLNARFKNVKSIPNTNIELTLEDTESLVGTLNILDEYFIDKDSEKLLNGLNSIDFETDELVFTQILLAGMEKIGISVREDSEEDMANQPMYKLLEKFITNQSGYLRFKNPEDDQYYTIQVGLTTNSINFLSDSTESAINYLQNMLI